MKLSILICYTVTMTSDELKSEEKRQQDAALEKENMNKAMTAQEEKAISTTYVNPSYCAANWSYCNFRPCALCPFLVESAGSALRSDTLC